jgi:transposase
MMSEEPTESEPSNQGEAVSPARVGETARQLIRGAKRASRRKFPAEEKIRVVMEGIRAEVSVADLCRREGIHPTIYYKWLKDFREAGKGRLRGDAKREATSHEVQDLRQENERLKLLVADLSLENLTLKKASIRAAGPKAVRTDEAREETGSD